jgi:DNA-binding NtrC family response regulator
MTATPLQVLVVEDDHPLRDLYTTLLREAGHTVCSAWTARGAIELIRTERVDLVLLDLELDGLMTGVDVWNKIPRGIPVIVVSGYSERYIHDTAVRAQRIRDGSTRFLPKPVDAGRLLSEIREMTE